MEIHIAREGQQLGPFPPDEVRRQLGAGKLLPTDYAWSEGATEWVQLADLPALAPLIPTPGEPLLSQAAPAAAPVADQTNPKSGLAVASMVLGILSVTFLPGVSGIAGIICGHIARGSIRRSGGRLAGDGMAVAGLVTSYIGLFVILLAVVFLFAVILGGMALPFFGATQMRARQTKSLGQAREIVTACRAYATDHQGKFPKTPEELVPRYLPNQQVFVCPLSGPGLAMGYEYFGGTDKDPDDKILLMSKYQDRDGQRVVARVNGAAKFEKPPLEFLPPGGR